MSSSDAQSNGSSVAARLIELITDMSDGEQRSLLEKLEEGHIAEKRAHPRKRYIVSVDYVTPEGLQRGALQNISVGGLLLQANEISTFSFGQKIRLRIPHPNRQKYIQTTGQVVRIDSQGIGVTFTRRFEAQE
jgi:phosphoribosylaminoimidazole (AIR) synthetase